MKKMRSRLLAGVLTFSLVFGGSWAVLGNDDVPLGEKPEVANETEQGEVPETINKTEQGEVLETINGTEQGEIPETSNETELPEIPETPNETEQVKITDKIKDLPKGRSALAFAVSDDFCNASDFPGLQKHLEEFAESTAEGMTISLENDITITAPLVIENKFGKTLTITSDGPINKTLTIGVVAAGGVGITVAEDTNLNMEKLNIAGGNAETGGILEIKAGANVAFTGRVMIENTTSVNGAIVNYGNLDINGGQIAFNKGTVKSGGITNYGSLIFNGTVIKFNEGVEGGAFYNAEGATLEGDAFTLRENTATGNGGLLYNAGIATIGGVMAANCSGGKGGSIYDAGSPYLCVEGILNNSEATDKGGGIYLDNASGQVCQEFINEILTMKSNHDSIVNGVGVENRISADPSIVFITDSTLDPVNKIPYECYEELGESATVIFIEDLGTEHDQNSSDGLRIISGIDENAEVWWDVVDGQSGISYKINGVTTSVIQAGSKVKEIKKDETTTYAITEDEFQFDKNKDNSKYKDIVIYTNFDKNIVSKITRKNEILVEGEDYAVNDNKITIYKGYLEALEVDEYSFIIDMGNDEEDIYFYIDVVNTSKDSSTGSSSGSNGSGDKDNEVAEKEFKNPFTDVNDTEWYYDSIMDVYKKEIMNGVSDKKFEPNTNVSRGMVATVLWNMEGSPAGEYPNPFTDLNADWYKEAVKWAASKDIVNGFGDGLYKPDEAVTREQLAVILYNYSKIKGQDVVGRSDLTGFVDYSEISNYALEELEWANHNGIINGRSPKMLVPKGTATRAELATMISNMLD